MRAVTRFSGMFELCEDQQSGGDDGVNTNKGDPKVNGRTELAIGSSGGSRKESRGSQRGVRNWRRRGRLGLKRFRREYWKENAERPGPLACVWDLIPAFPNADIGKHWTSLGHLIQLVFMIEVA
jgi:hypothetical protein